MNKQKETGPGLLERAFSFRALLGTLPIGVYCCDTEGVIWNYNDRAAALWGREPKIGDTEERFCGAHKLFLPDGTPLPHKQTPMAEVLRTAKPAKDLQVIVERPDGERVVALVNIEPLFDDDGDFVGAVNCFQDVTEMSRTQKELQRSKDELDDFFENASVGLHIVDGDGRILRANQAELELLGYDPSEYIGRHIADFYTDREAIDDILDRLSSGKRLDNYPARLRAKDGSIKHVLITSSGRFEDGEFSRTRCFTLDVTEAKQAEVRAYEGEQRLHKVLENFPSAVYTTDAEGWVSFFNPAAQELAGRELQPGSDRWTIFWRIYDTDGTPVPLHDCPMAVALRERRPVEQVELIIERTDGTRRRCIPYSTPLFDQDGQLTGVVNLLVDVTERHEAQIESAHLAAIVSSSTDAIVSKTLTGTIRSWNDGARAIFGYEAEEMIGQHITRIIPPELHAEEEEILSRLRRGERIEHFETKRVTKDGQLLDVSLTVSPIHDSMGRIIGASKVGRDITERKRAEELQRLLISELNHRVKNTLATVQSIANQTVRLARSPADFAASFSGRIQALAHTHDLLTRNSWKGADILQLIRNQLLVDEAEDKRISLSGPSVRLDPQPALHLALILHELGTNALKYGSLSVPNGKLNVEWTVRTHDGRLLELTWRESGGPPVEVPETRGFGTTLIEKSLATHGGEATMHYRAEGVACEITLPLPEGTNETFGVPAQAASSRQRETPALPASSLKGTRVLVVEDESLISMDIADALADIGCELIGPTATVEETMEFIEKGQFDVALLDANLGGRPVDAIAAALTRRNKPFGFLTGYGREGLPEAFRNAPMVNKPFTRAEALGVVSQLASTAEDVLPLRRKEK